MYQSGQGKSRSDKWQAIDFLDRIANCHYQLITGIRNATGEHGPMKAIDHPQYRQPEISTRALRIQYSHNQLQENIIKTNLKFLLPLLFLITAVIPVFAAFPGSGTREQSREIDLIRENSELSSENGELVRVDPDSYEPDDDAADYTLIDPTPFLGAQNHTLHSGTDLDWYRFYGYTDRNYHFYSTGTIDTDIYLYLDDGTTLLEYNLSFPHLSHCKLDQTNDSALTQRINWQSDT